MARYTRSRLAPMWVRELDRRQLHALTGKLVRLYGEEGLSDKQEWLLDRCLQELNWRRSHAVWPDPRCSCQFCFSELEEDAARPNES